MSPPLLRHPIDERAVEATRTTARRRFAPHEAPPFRIRPFAASLAAEVASWVRSDLELRWLAPRTSPPLTAEKVIEWVRPEGSAHLMVTPDAGEPIGYGELNPMAKRPGDMWVGHLLIRPDLRGRGLGTALTRELSRLAFERYGAERVSLVVFPENHSAIECYHRAGFRRAGVEPHEFTPGDRVGLIRYELPRRVTTSGAVG